MTDDVIYGTRGVLAYDEATDRVQCHVCGGWYRILSADHLKRHGLTAAAQGVLRTVPHGAAGIAQRHDVTSSEQGTVGPAAREARRLRLARFLRPQGCAIPWPASCPTSSW